MNVAIAELSPPTSAPEAAAQAFLTPSKTRRAASLGFLGTSRRVDTPSGDVAIAEAGTGPAVLLVHGWDGQAADLAAFAPPLLASGHRVIAIDLPAHGESRGERTSIPAAAEALLALQRHAGDLHAVIGHSVGAAVLVEAMARGLRAGSAVLLAAPARYADYAKAFATQAGLDREQAGEMVEALRRLGVDVHAVSMPAVAPMLRQAALFVHSADDRIVSIADAEESAAAWPGARLLRLEGLGHRRILQSPEVIAAVSQFIAAPTGARSA